MVVDYKSRKNEVLDSYAIVEGLVKELQSYAQKIQLPDPTERMGNLLADIRSKAKKIKEDRFNIMIAGESKSGKSTFINAYLGVELLPMDVKQCTSSIVEIKYGDVFSVRATYADGRQKNITGDHEAREFLKQNAALDDQYRDIPVPTINNEILVKSGLRARAKGAPISVSNAEVEAMLNAPEVQSANIYNLPLADYNARIKKYIQDKKNSWQDIVTKIEIMFPFGEDLRGIEIIDSPGVCARGGVAEITSHYIENADAIIFLKPVVGQSLESTQFSQFLENASVARNKNALFLVLTHISTKTDADLRRLEEEAYKQFSGKIDKENILFVDSKAEIYAKKFHNMENIKEEIERLRAEKTLEDFVLSAYSDTFFFGHGDTEAFIEKLKEKSRFASVYKALDKFGRKAHYILLAAMLDSIYKLYDKLWNDMNSRIEMFRQKTEDPTELANKIVRIKQELDLIQLKMNKGVDSVVRRFNGETGIIRKTGEEAVKDFLESVGEINPDADDAFNRLERLSLQKIDQFMDLTKALQKQVVDEFDKELVSLSDKRSIPFESLKPDFTDQTFQEIKESTESDAYETRQVETGATFKKTHEYSEYVQNKHFKVIKDNIVGRLENLKNDLVSTLVNFVERIRTRYIKELSNNAESKKKELDAIVELKNTAEQYATIIQELSTMAEKIHEAQGNAEKIRGGITNHVQRNN